MAVYGDLLRADPDDVQALCGTSRCMGKVGRLDEGLRLANRAASLAPDDDWPLRLRSAHLLLLGRPREALEDALAARAADPTGLSPLLSVFEAQITLRQRHEAAATAGYMVAQHPGEPESHNAVGRAAMLRKAWPDAEEAFSEALRLAPAEPVYQSNLALALERRGRRREAMQLFRGAVQTDPGNAAARRQLLHAVDRRLAIVGVVGGALVVVGTRLAAHPGDPRVWLAAMLVLLPLLAVVMAVRWWRLRQLDESVRVFYRHERRRWRALRFEVAICGGAVLLAAVLVIVAAAEVTRSWEVAFLTTAALLAALRFAGMPLWRRRVLPRLHARHGFLRTR
jgi:Flp pilus assembly protein TadD